MEVKYVKHIAQTGDKIVNGKLVPKNKPKEETVKEETEPKKEEDSKKKLTALLKKGKEEKDKAGEESA